jgi:hypothetical protein
MLATLVGFTVLGWLGVHLCAEHGASPSEHSFLIVTAVSGFVALCWYLTHVVH